MYYKVVMERLLNRIRSVRPGMCESGDWFLFARQRPVPQRDNRQAVFGPTKVTVLDYPPYSPDLAPADYILFPKVKSHLKGRLFDSI